MRSAADLPIDAGALYEGVSGSGLANRLGLPRVVVFHEIGSTLDAAHSLAEKGAPAGTLILADAQTSGRGRAGRAWRSDAGAGVWLTLIERPSDASALDVLSLRVGLALAPALDSLAGETIRLKWPNDLYVGDRKLGGILVEARWRDGAPDWIAIGVGINVRAPSGEPRATGLRPDARRLVVLDLCVPAIRSAAARSGSLDDAERTSFDERDLAKGRACVSPVAGHVRGIDAGGALVIAIGSEGSETIAVRSGSLVFTEEQ